VERAGSNPCVSVSEGLRSAMVASLAAVRTKASRPCLTRPHPPRELGAWSTRVTREGTSGASRIGLRSASYPSAGTDEGGAHDDDTETSEVGIVRERLLQPCGAGGRHPQSLFGEMTAETSQDDSTRAANNSSELAACATEDESERTTSSGRCIERRSAEAGASNRAPPPCLPPGANPLGVCRESSTGSTAMPRHLFRACTKTSSGD